MRRSFFVRLVLLNTFKKRVRAGLVVFGIAATTSVMIVLFGVSAGLQSLVTDQVQNSEAKDVVTVDQRNLQQVRFTPDKVSEIKSMGGATQVETSVGLLGNVVYHGIDLTIPLYGVSKNFFAVSPVTFVSGDGGAMQGTSVVVSTKVLDALGIPLREAVGKEIMVSVTSTPDNSSTQKEQAVTSRPETFTISGVVDRGALPVAYLPAETTLARGVDMASQVKVKVGDPAKIPALREGIEQMGFQTNSVQDSVEQIEKLFTVIHKTVGLFAIIVFAITVFGTFTIISLTLMEEMPQIGFLRVSGLRNRDVRLMFILQSVVLTTLGAVAGVIGGLLLGGVVNSLARAAAAGEVFTGDVRVFEVPAGQVSAVLFLAVVIGWAVGLFPAKRAVLANPLEEMKS